MLFGSALPVMVGLVTLVMLSVLERSESLSAIRSRSHGALMAPSFLSFWQFLDFQQDRYRIRFQPLLMLTRPWWR